MIWRQEQVEWFSKLSALARNVFRIQDHY